MQTSSVVKSPLGQEKSGWTRGRAGVRETGSGVNVSTRFQDTVATISLAVLLTIVFALVY